jgi:hypothetical protein
MKAKGTQFFALSLSADSAVRCRVASDLWCPAEVLISLLNDDDKRVSDLAFVNPSLPADARTKVWEYVVREGHFDSAQGAQLRRVMFTPNAPADLLERILSHPFDNFKPEEPQNMNLRFFVRKLFESPNCPARAVRRAIIDGPPEKRNWAAGNPSPTPDLVQILIEDGSNMFELAVNPAGRHRISEIVPRLSTWELTDVPRNFKDNGFEAVVLCTKRLSKWLLQNPESGLDVAYSDFEAFPRDVVLVLAEYSSSPEEVSRLCCHENPYVRHLAGRKPIATAQDQVMVALLAGT